MGNKSKFILLTFIILISIQFFPFHYGIADVGDSQENPIVITKREYENIQVGAGSSKWFELPMNGRLLKDVSIEFDNSTANLDLFLWDTSTVLTNSTSLGNSESISYYYPTYNSYFVEIRNLNLSTTGIFNLSILPDDSYENNNDFENATILNPYTGYYLDYLILNDREIFNISYLNDAYISIWINWFGDFHYGFVELYGLENTTLLVSKSYLGGFSTTHITYNPDSNGTVSVVINDTQIDLGIYYSIRIDIMYEDEYETNNNLSESQFLYLESSHYRPFISYGKYFDLTMTDKDYYYIEEPSWIGYNSTDTTLLIFVNFSSYIYGYVPSLALTLYSSDQILLERSIGEIDNQGIPFLKIYHTVDDHFYFIGISPMKEDYFVRYSLTIVIYEGPPEEDPWDAISLARPGDPPYYPPAAISGFPISFIIISVVGSIFVLVKRSRYFQKKIDR